MRVLVTRPQPQADRWVDRLRGSGVEAVALPLIDVAAAPDPAAVEAAWRGMAQRRLAVFVSPNAAARFFASRPAGMDWPAATRAASIGPGTTEALVALGVPPDRIVAPADDSPQFDSEALWLRLAHDDWAGAAVLMVRGDGGREWLAERLRERGARVEAVAAYARVAPRLDGSDVLAQALAAPVDHLWLLSSSEAVGHLGRAVPGQDWQAARAIATHPRIAQAARALGFGRVVEAAAGFEAVRACIQSAAS